MDGFGLYESDSEPEGQEAVELDSEMLANSQNPLARARMEPNTSTYVNNLDKIFFGRERSVQEDNDEPEFNFGRAVSTMNDQEKKSFEAKNQKTIASRGPILRGVNGPDNIDNQSASAAMTSLGKLLRDSARLAGTTSAIGRQDSND